MDDALEACTRSLRVEGEKKDELAVEVSDRVVERVPLERNSLGCPSHDRKVGAALVRTVEADLHHRKIRHPVQPAKLSEEDSEEDSAVDSETDSRDSRESKEPKDSKEPEKVEAVEDAVAQPPRHRCRLADDGVVCSVSVEEASAEV